jgi:hypothetical protein
VLSTPEELDLLQDRAARLAELTAGMRPEDFDAEDDTLRNMTGALQVLLTYARQVTALP